MSETSSALHAETIAASTDASSSASAIHYSIPWNSLRLAIASDIQSPTSVVLRALVIVALLWVFYRGLRLVIATIFIFRLRHSRTALRNVVLQNQIDTWLRNKGRQHPIRLYESPLIDVPCVTWLQRDAIYLPTAFHAWKQEEQSASLAHELAHLMRRDAVTRLLSDLLQLFIGLQPLTWLLHRRLCFAQEIATDRLAAEMTSTASYRSGLASLVLRFDSVSHRFPSNALVSVSTNNMIRRITMLNSVVAATKLSRFQKFAWFAGSCVALMTLTVCRLDAQQPIRIASRPGEYQELARTNTKQSATRPWEALGNSDGYLVVRPIEMAKLPSFKREIDSLQTALQLPITTGQPSLSFDLVVFMSTCQSFVTENKDPNVSNDQRYRVEFKTDRFLFDFSRAIDWSAIASNINLGALARGDDVQTALNFLRERGTSNQLTFFMAPGVDRSEPAVHIKEAWSLVDGGMYSMVVPLQGFQDIDWSYTNDKLTTTDKQYLKLLSMSQSMACRIAFDAAGDIALRVVFIPATGVDVNAVTQAAAPLLSQPIAEPTAEEQSEFGLSKILPSLQSIELTTVELPQSRISCMVMDALLPSEVLQ